MADAPLPIVLVGDDEEAERWARLVEASPRLVLAARVPTGGPALDAALAAHPQASVAAAVGPRAAFAVAQTLCTASRPGLLRAPIHGVDGVPDGPVWAGFGWTRLPGLARFLEATAGAQRLELLARGTPTGPSADLEDVLWHACAVLHRLDPGIRIASAAPRDAGAYGEAGGDREVTWEAQPGTPSLRLSAEGIAWTWRPEDETWSRSAGPPRRRPAEPMDRRVLATLLDPPAAGAAAIRAVGALVTTVLEALPTRRPLRLRALADSARCPPDALLARLGLRGAVPAAASPAPLDAPLPPGLTERWAFEAGLKPVAFLTVRPEDVESTVSSFGAVHVERRDRRVAVGDQDRWIDRRDLGEPRVELYLSSDPDLARRAAFLQAETDPSEALLEMGGLLGYPECCVRAFAAQPDRSNNTWNRYATAARTPPGARWAWELNNLTVMLAPFFPCSYACPPAAEYAGAVHAAIAAAHPDLAERLASFLRRPVLYFDDRTRIALEGTATTSDARFDEARPIGSADGQLVELAAAIGQGTRLAWSEDRLLVADRDRTVMVLDRIDPGLGLLAPFRDAD